MWKLIAPDSSLTTPNVAACGRLVRREFVPHELPSLINTILSSHDKDEMIRCLPGDDAQTFIDVMDEARSTFTHYRETDADVFWQPGTGFTRSLTAGSKEAPQVVIQDMWPTRAASEIFEGSHLLRQDRSRTVQGWVCGCLEGRVSRSGRCCEGHEDIPE